MQTDLLLMDAWRDKSNRAYQTYKQAIAAPGLFTPEYRKDLAKEVLDAEKHHNFWRGQE